MDSFWDEHVVQKFHEALGVVPKKEAIKMVETLQSNHDAQRQLQLEIEKSITKKSDEQATKNHNAQIEAKKNIIEELKKLKTKKYKELDYAYFETHPKDTTNFEPITLIDVQNYLFQDDGKNPTFMDTGLYKKFEKYYKNPYKKMGTEMDKLHVLHDLLRGYGINSHAPSLAQGWRVR